MSQRKKRLGARMAKQPTRKNQTDSTLRNVRAVNKKIALLQDQIQDIWKYLAGQRPLKRLAKG